MAVKTEESYSEDKLVKIPMELITTGLIFGTA